MSTFEKPRARNMAVVLSATSEKECYSKNLTELNEVLHAQWVPLAWGRCGKTPQKRRADGNFA